MARRMFALLDAEGDAIEYASPAEGRDGELYTRRLEADPNHIEVHPETREPLKPAKAKASKPAEPSSAETPTRQSSATGRGRGLQWPT